MPARFTLADLKKSACADLNGHLFTEQAKGKRVQQTPAGLQHIMAVLDRLAIPYFKEHRFHPERRWRFDVAIPYLKCGIEYEGLMSKKSRHTTRTGYTGDAEKYNAAQALGWKVYRYTALNYQDFATDLQTLLTEAK